MSDIFEKVQGMSWDEMRDTVHRENLALAYQFCGSWPKATQARVANAMIREIGRRAARPTRTGTGDRTS